jgi:hypothetical protein
MICSVDFEYTFGDSEMSIIYEIQHIRILCQSYTYFYFLTNASFETKFTSYQVWNSGTRLLELHKMFTNVNLLCVNSTGNAFESF